MMRVARFVRMGTTAHLEHCVVSRLGLSLPVMGIIFQNLAYERPLREPGVRS